MLKHRAREKCLSPCVKHTSIRLTVYTTHIPSAKSQTQTSTTAVEYCSCLHRVTKYRLATSHLHFN